MKEASHMLKIQFRSVCDEQDGRHPMVNSLTVLVSLMGLAAASIYFLMVLHSPDTVLPVLLG